jgi:NAD(P)H-dependent FMN reductase
MLNIGIIIGSTREGRVGPQVASWILAQGSKSGLNLSLVDLKDFDLPLLGTAEAKGFASFQSTIQALDGFIFVTPEYNHSIPASLKNAIDYLRDEWANKVAGIVSYGGLGGARATEHLRGILGELQVADVRSHVAFLMNSDFKNWSEFTPQDYHQANVTALFSQLTQWGNALKTIR